MEYSEKLKLNRFLRVLCESSILIVLFIYCVLACVTLFAYMIN